MKYTGERVVPTDMRNNIDTYQQHLARYVWALQFVKGKTVLDAACGCGYGTDLLSYVTRSAIGTDNCEEALNYASKFFVNGFYVKDDLENPKHPYNVDTIVTFETIEHLDDPKKFLEWCKAHSKEVIGSIPVNCKTEFHKHVYSSKQVCELIFSVFPQAKVWKQSGINIVEERRGDVVYTGDMILFRGEC